MQTTKAEIIDALSNLPETATVEDIIHHIHLVDKLKRSKEAVKNGQTYTTEDLRKKFIK